MDIHNPSFLLFPVNNNRTAWKPFGLPIILVVPHKRDLNGSEIADSDISNVRIYIEDVPQVAKVSGHRYIGLRFPDKELYSNTITNIELEERKVELINLTITNTSNEIVSLEDASTNDTIHYTTRSNVTSTMPFIIGADYYDLSDITINIESLIPDIYNIVYEVSFNRRLVSDDSRNTFLCIATSQPVATTFKFKIDHPGKLLREWHRLTPDPYLPNSANSSNTTLALYRPFTDIMQDAMDEQDLLEHINWVFNTPPEAIPYLSALLGWEIPYFPQSLDQLRVAVLRRTVEFQNLKGSKRAITNIFRLFGFEILISNLWWSQDGKMLIRPDKKLPAPYDAESITTSSINQIDLILDKHNVKDFNPITIPLLFRPQEKSGLNDFTALRDGGTITITAYTIANNSEAQTAFDNISKSLHENYATYGQDNCTLDHNNNPFPTTIHDIAMNYEFAGYSQLTITGKLGEVDEQLLVGSIIPLRKNGVSLSREANTITIYPNGISQFDGYSIYAYATYKRYEFNVPTQLTYRQSNKFEIQVLTDNLLEFADPTTLEFAVEFLYRLKAFHSQLYAINTSIDLSETYEVTDLSVGGDYEQRHDTDIGKLQVPPAIIPSVDEANADCTKFSPTSLGYKQSDIILRTRKLNNLIEEYEAWKALDGRISNTISNTVTSNIPIDGRNDCLYTGYGQDRIVISERPNVDTVISTDNVVGGDYGSPNKPVQNKNFIRESYNQREPICKINGSDYYYKGRVDDDVEYSSTLDFSEQSRYKPTALNYGYGTYWTYPSVTTFSLNGTASPASRSHTEKSLFTGGAAASGVRYYISGTQEEYLSVSTAQKLQTSKESFIGRLYRDYKVGSETIHYSNDENRISIDQRYQLALQRPSLDIQIPTSHFPGCRFPMFNALKEDYIDNSYTARPWDFDECPQTGSCLNQNNPLNCVIINDTLVFDSQPYIIYGNGITPDISNFGEHTFGASNINQSDVVHSVYMKGAGDNPAVSFDDVCDYGTGINDGLIDTNKPIFSSYNSCGTSFKDYADGYPCVTGKITYVEPESNVYDELLGDLGLPVSIANPDLTFLYRSGISHDAGYRYDGGCGIVDCGSTVGLSTLCSLDVYLDENGEYDFSQDNLSIVPRLELDEIINTDNYMMDGSIRTFLETI